MIALLCINDTESKYVDRIIEELSPTEATETLHNPVLTDANEVDCTLTGISTVYNDTLTVKLSAGGYG